MSNSIDPKTEAETPATTPRSGLKRRDFLRRFVAIGAAAVGAIAVTKATEAKAQAPTTFAIGEEGAPPRPGGGGGHITTHAIGEEGNPRPGVPRPDVTTYALGEEQGPGCGTPPPRITTRAIGEEGRPATTYALGEESAPGTYPRGHYPRPSIGGKLPPVWNNFKRW